MFHVSHTRLVSHKGPFMPRMTAAIPLSTALIALMTAASVSAQTPQQGKKAPTAPPHGGVRLGTATVAPPPGLVLFNKAMQAYKTGDYAGSERLLRKAAQLDPRDPQAWANLGLSLTIQHKTDEAIAAFKKAIAVSPNEKAAAPFWSELARLYGYNNRWSDCVAAARKSLALGNTRNMALTEAYLGLALVRQGKFADAIPVLKKGRSFPGEPASAPEVRLIVALRGANQTAEATARARALAAKFPKEAGLQLLSADLAVKSGDLVAAGEAYTRAFLLDPTDRRAGTNAAIAAEQRGDRPVSTAIFRLLVERFPDDARLHYQLGVLLYSDPSNRPTQFAEAEKELNIAAAREPTNPVYVAQVGLAMMLQGQKHFALAENYLKSSLKLDANLPMAHVGLGYIAEQQNDTATALKEYRTVVALNRDDDSSIKARRRLASLLYATGQKDEAYTAFEAIVARYPDARGTNALAELASLLATDNKLDKAEAAYAKLATLAPKDPDVYLGLGHVEEQLKKPEAARVQYAKALELDPQNDTATLLLGGLLKADKKADEAIALYEKILKTAPVRGGTDHNQVRRQLASDYEEKGQIDEALRVLGSVIRNRKDDPNRINDLLARARVMIAHGRKSEAVAELTALSQENPKEDAFIYALADAQENAGHPDAAERTLTGILTRYQNAPRMGQQARILLGELQVRQNRLDDAAARFEDALRLDPLDTRALPNLTKVREQQKRPEAVGQFLEAGALSGDRTPPPGWQQAVERQYRQYNQPERLLAFSKRAAEKYPNDRPTLLGRVAALMPDGLKRDSDLKEMDTLLARLLLLDPNDARGHFYLGQVREAQQRPIDAIAEYTQSVRLTTDSSEASQALRRLNAPVPVPDSAHTPSPAVPQVPTAVGQVVPPAGGNPPPAPESPNKSGK